MKTIFIAIFFLLPSLIFSQAMLGHTLTEIKANNSSQIFEVDYTNDGGKYASTEFDLGTMMYYFDENGYSYMCIQVPHNMTALSTLVELYNNKYVVISDTSWKAYLDGGYLMKINLNYSEKYKLYSFVYTD